MNIFGFPLYIVVAIIFVLSFILFAIVKAYREGREIQFWPPKIGPRPNSKNSNPQISDIVPPAPIYRYRELNNVKIPKSPIAILHIFESEDGKDDGELYILNENSRRIVIGSANRNDISLSDGTVSKTHCTLVIDRKSNNFHITIIDMGSTNGTKVNDRHVRSKTLLQNRDVLTIGDRTKMRVFILSNQSDNNE